MTIDGIRLIGVNGHTGEKLLFTLVLIVVVFVLRAVLTAIAHAVFDRFDQKRVRFWSKQGVNLATGILLVLGLVSIWFDDPKNLATAVGLVTAGLAFALQRVVTAFAGYLVLLRGKTFNVGDRIVMGGVRGDVISLGFMQTTIMEMGEPPSVQGAPPAMWIYGRQYTGRIVSVNNSVIFDNPVYNYSRDFPLIWEELHVTIDFTSDYRKVEQILLDSADRHSRESREQAQAQEHALARKYGFEAGETKPRVFVRLTENWLELAVRFVTPAHGARAVKDAMTREIIDALNAAKIAISNGTTTISSVPPLQIVASSSSMNALSGSSTYSPNGAQTTKP